VLPKSVFETLHDESADLEARLAALRAVSRSPGAINQLVRQFYPPELRAAAVVELERIARAPLPPYLEKRIGQDLAAARTDPLATQFANLGLAYGRDARVLDLARASLSDSHPDVRSRAVGVLASIGEIDAVLAAAGDSAAEVRASVAEMLGYFCTARPEDLAALEALAADPEPKVAAKARAAQRRLRVKPLPRGVRTPARAGDEHWLELLTKLAAKVLADRNRAADLPDEALATGWLGTTAATEEQLQTAERRLGVKFPVSYRSFLATSNGWGPTSFFLDRLYGADEVVWFADSEPDWLAIWASTAEGPQLKTALQVSSVTDNGVCLLIPSEQAEWECWFFANWIPGVHRHASFRAFMDAELAR
jgi:HEAT repeats/SMI1 / KNR4 family (SUKH-1)